MATIGSIALGRLASAASSNVCPGDAAARCRSRAQTSGASAEVHLHIHGVGAGDVAALVARNANGVASKQPGPGTR